MNINYLRYFTTIARLHTFSRAAENLHVSPPTLSYAIKALEQELGAPLFVTSNKGAVLTDFGRLFLPYAVNALGSLDAGVDALSRYLKEQRVINIAAVGYMSAGQAPWFIQKFYESEAGRNTRVNVIMYPADETLRMVWNGYSDLGFTVIDDSEMLKDLEVYPIAYDKYYLLLHFTHELTGKKKISMADLLGYDFIGYDEHTSASHTIADRFERECGRQPNTIARFRYSFEIAGMVAANLGVAIATDKQLISRSRLVLREIDNKPWTRTTGLVYRKEALSRKVVRDFVELIKEWVPKPIPAKDYPDQFLERPE